MQKLFLPFLAGFLAVLFFQEASLAMLHAANISAVLAYSTTPIAPLGTPEFLTNAVLGGFWGLVLAWVLRVAPQRPAPWVGALVFGGVALTAADIFVIAPLQGVWPTGNILPRIVFGFCIHAMWGWGALVFMRAFMSDVDDED
jgi:hypothetical protein